MLNDPEIGRVIGQVETDSFCEGCGYNLHTQAVVRDERLGIPITRCPECGRFAASGYRTSASRLWLGRLGTILLTAWVFFLLMLFAFFALFLGMVAYGHMESKTTVASNPAAAATGGAYQYSYHYVVAPPPPPGSELESQATYREIALGSIAASLGFGSGASFAIFLWHCKRGRCLFCILPAVTGCGVAILIWDADPTAYFVRTWGAGQILQYCLLECVAAGAGFWFGRPIARAALRILVPPKPRQSLAFLWTTDGKTLRI